MYDASGQTGVEDWAQQAGDVDTPTAQAA